MTRRVLLLPAFAVLFACGKPPERGAAAAEGEEVSASRTTTAQGLSLVPGENWQARTPSSAMRLLDYAIPRAEGDAADGELVLYYFGKGQGGTVELNLERWYGQFEQPDGSSSKEKAKVEKREVSGLRVTTVEVSGRHKVTAGAPGMRAYDEPGWRMYAAIVETAKGPFFFKAVGPEKTILGARPALEAMVGSVRLDG